MSTTIIAFIVGVGVAWLGGYAKGWLDGANKFMTPQQRAFRDDVIDRPPVSMMSGNYGVRPLRND
jgi:hypothetical protein